MGTIGEGVHKLTFAGTAVVDYVATLALAVCVTLATRVPLVLTTAACMLLSVVAHAAFGVDTRAMRWLRDG
jgi:hypothetical protein